MSSLDVALVAQHPHQPQCPCGAALKHRIHRSENASVVCWCDVCYHTMHDGESYYQCTRKHTHAWEITPSPYGVTWQVQISGEDAVSIEMCGSCSTRFPIDREREHSVARSYRQYAWW